MKITVKRHTTMTIDEFADKYQLVMEVVERDPVIVKEHHIAKWYANFDNVDVKEGFCLVGVYGNGNTPREAVLDYANKISGKTIVVNAIGEEKCCRLLVPILSGINDGVKFGD